MTLTMIADLHSLYVYDGTSGSRAGVARRIVFRPRWWIELEMLLKDPSW